MLNKQSLIQGLKTVRKLRYKNKKKERVMDNFYDKYEVILT